LQLSVRTFKPQVRKRVLARMGKAVQGAVGPEFVKEMPPKMTPADFSQDGRQEGVKAILLDLVPKNKRVQAGRVP